MLCITARCRHLVKKTSVLEMHVQSDLPNIPPLGLHGRLAGEQKTPLLMIGQSIGTWGKHSLSFKSRFRRRSRYDLAGQPPPPYEIFKNPDPHQPLSPPPVMLSLVKLVQIPSPCAICGAITGEIIKATATMRLITGSLGCRSSLRSL